MQILIPEDQNKTKPEYSVGEIAERVKPKQSEVSRRLKGLKEKNILESKKSDEDRRKTVYRVTESYIEELYKLKQQETDIEFIENTPLEKISFSVGTSGKNLEPAVSANLYGVNTKEDDFRPVEAGVKEEIRTVRRKLRSHYEPEMKEEFRSSLQTLVEEHTEDRELQEELEELLDELVDAIWNIDRLRKEYSGEEFNLSSEIDAETSFGVIEVLEEQNKKLKWRIKSLESTSKFIQEAKKKCKEAKTMRITIN